MVAINTPTLTPQNTKERTLFIDMLKTIAIFGVLIIHQTPRAFLSYAPFSLSYIFTVLISCAVRFSVPVFIMCSGALFLSEEKSVSAGSIYKKYIPRILAALLLFAVFYEAVSLCLSFRESGVWDRAYFSLALNNLLTFNTHFHLYYLYIMVLIYALIPPLKIFLKSASKRDLEYLILFFLVSGILLPFMRNFYPFDRYFCGMTLQYSLNLTYSMLTYFILGHYLNKYPPEGKDFTLLTIAGILGIMLNFTLITAGVVKSGTLPEFYLAGTSPTVLFTSAFVFSASKKLCENKSINGKFFTFVSKASFTIYLIHQFYNILFEEMRFNILSFTPFLSLPALILSNFLLSLATYLVLRKIPGLRKIL